MRDKREKKFVVRREFQHEYVSLNAYVSYAADARMHERKSRDGPAKCSLGCSPALRAGPTGGCVGLRQMCPHGVLKIISSSTHRRLHSQGIDHRWMRTPAHSRTMHARRGSWGKLNSRITTGQSHNADLE